MLSCYNNKVEALQNTLNYNIIEDGIFALTHNVISQKYCKEKEYSIGTGEIIILEDKICIIDVKGNLLASYLVKNTKVESNKEFLDVVESNSFLKGKITIIFFSDYLIWEIGHIDSNSSCINIKTTIGREIELY